MEFPFWAHLRSIQRRFKTPHLSHARAVSSVLAHGPPTVSPAGAGCAQTVVLSCAKVQLPDARQVSLDCIKDKSFIHFA
jgi:hypothetical protein